MVDEFFVSHCTMLVLIVFSVTTIKCTALLDFKDLLAIKSETKSGKRSGDGALFFAEYWLYNLITLL